MQSRDCKPSQKLCTNGNGAVESLSKAFFDLVSALPKPPGSSVLERPWNALSSDAFSMRQLGLVFVNCYSHGIHLQAPIRPIPLIEGGKVGLRGTGLLWSKIRFRWVCFRELQRRGALRGWIERPRACCGPQMLGCLLPRVGGPTRWAHAPLRSLCDNTHNTHMKVKKERPEAGRPCHT